MQSMDRTRAAHLLEVLVINQKHHDEQHQIDLHLWQQPSRFGRVPFRPLGCSARRASAGPISFYCCTAHLQRQNRGLQGPGWHEVQQSPSERSDPERSGLLEPKQAPALTTLRRVQMPCPRQVSLTNTECKGDPH